MVATQPDSDVVKLIIADHLDWTDIDSHSQLLQDKINTYLSFIESGQMRRIPGHEMPASPEIRITLAVPQTPAAEALPFLDRVREYLRGVGIGFETELRAPDASPR